MSRHHQPSLFDDESLPASRDLVEVVRRAQPENKAQANFRRLIQQIEEQKKALQEWIDFEGQNAQRVHADMLPLYDELWQTQQKLLEGFDRALTQPGKIRSKRRRSQMESCIVALAAELLEYRKDAKIEKIHDKYADLSIADGHELEMALMQDMLENTLGINLGDDHGASTPEELAQHADRVIREEKEKQPKPKEKNRRSQSAATKREQAEKEISQSVREIFRKLASALHPDREPDPELRTVRTEQMQRANRAYEARDLLTLLNIQLEIEQIDAKHIENLSEQRLAHYNVVLKEQLAEIKQEIREKTLQFQHLVPPGLTAGPSLLKLQFERELEGCKKQIAETRQQLLSIDTPTGLDKLIDLYATRYAPSEDFNEMVELMEIAVGFSSSPPKRGPKRSAVRRSKKR